MNEFVTFSRDDLEPVAELLIKKHGDAAFTRAVNLALDNLAGPNPQPTTRKRRTPVNPATKPALTITWQLQCGVLIPFSYRHSALTALTK